MDPDRWNRIEELFAAAIELDPSERDAFLREACSSDEDLRMRVQALLAADSAGHSLLDRRVGATLDSSGADPVASSADSADAGPLAPGSMLGNRYRIVVRLGRGGMGEVYRAEQIEPIRRSVALKVIKAGMDTHAVLARFEAERKTLALMSHPSIAQVFDAGETELGRPYFAMEFVEGVPLIEYCDRHTLTLDERLDLFVTVCKAVQHAHQKGIIHRDLKPSNILVSDADTEPIPKIIDFGIAKATSGSLSDLTAFTLEGQVIGTPAYMSPEQAEGSLDIDTRTDVYSLGVVLYELLTGSRPFDDEGFTDAGIGTVQKTIREVEPPRPSTRIETRDADSREVARRRGTDSRTLVKHLRGDLDWVILKAMEKHPDRRYQAASDLALELERFRRNEPVAAGPPSLRYRALKFVRRHRAAVFAAGVAVAAVLGGTVLATIGLIRAKTAERQARVAERLAEDRADALGRSNWKSYAGTITSAARAVQAGDPKTAADLLEVAVGEHRGWEHRYLTARVGGNDAVTEFERAADDWRLAASGARLFALDARYPGLADDRGCLVEPGRRVVLELEGASVTVSGFGEVGRTFCIVEDAWATPAVSDLAIPGNGTLVMDFDPPIRAFYAYFGAMAEGGTVTMDLWFGDSRTATVTSAECPRRLAAIGHGFVSGTPVDRIEFTASDYGGVVIGAFNGLPDGEPSLGTVTIPGYAGPRGSEVDVDFGCVFLEGPDLRDAAAYEGVTVLRSDALYVHGVGFAGREDWIVSGGWDGHVRFWDAKSGESIGTLPTQEAQLLSLATARAPIIATGHAGGRARLWHAETGGHLADLVAGSHPVHSLDLSADGTRLAARSYGTVEVLNLDPQTAAVRKRLLEVAESDAGVARITAETHGAIALSPDGAQVAANVTGGFAVWELATGGELYRTGHLESFIYDLAYSPDGRLLASGGDDDIVRLWDAESGSPLVEMHGHTSTIYALAFFPDGTRLASGADDRSILVWDTRHGDRLLDLTGHHDYVSALAFSPDGAVLVSGSGDHTLRAWNTRPIHERWQARIRDRTAGGPTRLARATTPVVARDPSESAIPAPAGLIGRWPGDGNARDVSSGSDGTPSSGVTYAAGVVGQAFSLDGEDDHVIVPDAPALDPPTQAITVEAWVRVEVLGATLMSRYDTSIGERAWAFNLRSDGVLQWGVYNDLRKEYRMVETIEGLIRPRTFHHVAASFDIRTQAMKTYVDGQEVPNRFAPRYTSTLSAFADTAAPVRLGAFVGIDGTTRGFLHGLLDEVAIYDRALTPLEIRTLYRAGSAGKWREESPRNR